MTASITGQVQVGFEEAIPAAGMAANYILVGDTEHFDAGVNDFKTSDGLIKSLAESGVAHLCLEVPEHLQGLADQYMTGVIDDAEFKSRFGAAVNITGDEGISEAEVIQGIVNTMDRAKAYGMDVHFVDPGTPEPTRQEIALAQEVFGIYEEATGQSVDTTSLPSVLESMQYVVDNDLISDEKKIQIDEMWKRYIEERSNDAALHDNITEATNGEKTAIVYGSRHDDLVVRLGEDQVFIVDAYADGPAYHDRLEEDTRNDVKDGQPDFVYIADKGELYITDKNDNAAELPVDEHTRPASGSVLGVTTHPVTHNFNLGMDQ